MTKEKQRIAIAEWKDQNWMNSLSTVEERLFRLSGVIPPDANIPNYAEDLNAIHEAEKKLLASEHTDMLGHNYLQVLWEVCGDIYFKQITVCVATASQRSEALCRTLWPERFQ